VSPFPATIGVVPELPEVEETRRRLRTAMHGVRIDRVLMRRPDLRFPLAEDFVRRLEGQTVRAVRRRAKYLAAELSSGDLLLAHLGMSGSFRVEPHCPTISLPHDHVVFELASGSTVVFNDPRRFGSMRIVDRAGVADDPVLSALGPEPLDRRFDGKALADALARRKTSLKAALSDQRVVAGLGNIYVCEALHRARLSPRRTASTLITRSGAPKPEADTLVQAIKDVLRDAIARTQRSYRDSERFRVYDREGRRCLRRGCRGVVKRIVQAGRSTFFCPVCQR
jgi:formamidopyrimidine-DNA glycosylase